MPLRYFSRLGRAFIFLWISMFIIVFADSLTWPVIPYLVKEFLVEEAAVVAVLGLLTSTFNLTQIAANILGGFAGDKVDRRLIILLSFILLPISFALLLFAADHIWILGSYILLGIFYGIFMPPVNAIVASLVPKELKGTLFGIFNLSWILSQIPAPLVGGLLSRAMSLRFPLKISFILSLVIPALYIAFREPLGEMPSQSQSSPESETKQEAVRLPMRKLLLLCSARFFFGLGNGVLSPMITAFLIYVIGVSPTEMGLVYSIGWGLATALAQIPGGRLSDKLGYRLVIVASTLISSPLVLLIPLSSRIEHFMVINSLLCLFGSLALPAFPAYVAALMGRRGLSRGFGLSSASYSLGLIVGPIIGSLLWTTFQPNYLPPFAISAAFFLLTLPFIIALKGS